MCSVQRPRAMIGYMLEQELGNLLPFEQPLATLLTMVRSTQRSGVSESNEVRRSRIRGRGGSKNPPGKGWIFKQDGNKWRRVVPLSSSQANFRIRPIRWLLDQGTIVICAGGGGIPTMYERGKERVLGGVEAVIDKDLCSALLARELSADLLIMATDAEAVFTRLGNGRPEGDFQDESGEAWSLFISGGVDGSEGRGRVPLRQANRADSRHWRTADIGAILNGQRGTIINPSLPDMTWA